MKHIAETIMVELQETTSGILGEVFFMEVLFPEYLNKVALDPFLA